MDTLYSLTDGFWRTAPLSPAHWTHGNVGPVAAPRTIVRVITRPGNFESSTPQHNISMRASIFATPTIKPGRTQIYTAQGPLLEVQPLHWSSNRSRSSGEHRLPWPWPLRGEKRRLSCSFNRRQLSDGATLSDYVPTVTDSKLAPPGAAIGPDSFSEQIPDIPPPPVPDKMARVRAALPAALLTAVWLHCSRKLDHNEL